MSALYRVCTRLFVCVVALAAFGTLGRSVSLIPDQSRYIPGWTHGHRVGQKRALQRRDLRYDRHSYLAMCG